MTNAESYGDGPPREPGEAPRGSGLFGGPAPRREDARSARARPGPEGFEEPPAAGDPSSDWRRIRDASWPGEASEGSPTQGRPPSLSSVLMLLEAVRAVVPRDLERQFTALLREALLTLRAVIDWYLERLDRGREERRMEDIPID